ncbi:hypothetical protein RN001_013676 [Aquatica leii]|uniref:Uncharacterized protein n=1 Tax=Aquatica leii TaxID=1421715 RepID=A0AAN7P2U1_9COLE|nr:hypothetical protein RN001_013676 [Aquatica leii]
MPYVGLSKVQRRRIITLVEQGMSQRQIAATVGVYQDGALNTGIFRRRTPNILFLAGLQNTNRMTVRYNTGGRRLRNAKYQWIGNGNLPPKSHCKINDVS